MRAGAVTKQHQLFLYAILHVTACTVMLFIQRLCRPCFSIQRRHHESRVLSFFQMLGLGHYPSRAAPTLPRLVNEFLEQPGGPSRLLILSSCLVHFLGNLGLQTFVLRQLWCAKIPVHEIANVVARLVTLPFLLILQRSLSTRKRP